MTCEHGFIGACAVCDGAGQIPEIPECPHCGRLMDVAEGEALCIPCENAEHARQEDCYARSTEAQNDDQGWR